MRRKTGLPKAGRDLMAELLGMDTREAKPRIRHGARATPSQRLAGFRTCGEFSAMSRTSKAKMNRLSAT